MTNQEKLEVMEFRSMRQKTRHHEIAGEQHPILMMKFLLHFLFVEHEHKMVQLFDNKDDMF